jgi:hypothetical protein
MTEGQLKKIEDKLGTPTERLTTLAAALGKLSAVAVRTGHSSGGAMSNELASMRTTVESIVDQIRVLHPEEPITKIQPGASKKEETTSEKKK